MKPKSKSTTKVQHDPSKKSGIRLQKMGKGLQKGLYIKKPNLTNLYNSPVFVTEVLTFGARRQIAILKNCRIESRLLVGALALLGRDDRDFTEDGK